MSAEDLKKVKNLYNIKGGNYTISDIENCFSHTAKTHNIPTTDIFAIIGPYLYEEKYKSELTASPSPQDFVFEDYDISIDDQSKNKVDYSNQEYLSRDFRKSVVHRFPIFDEYSEIPAKFGKKTYWQVQRGIKSLLPNLENLNWSNQTLSYARSNVVEKHIVECILYPLYKSGLFGDFMQIVDTTGNIGADSIGFAMEKFVSHVTTYEILRNVYDMLMRNIDLYGMNDKITAINQRFDYVVPTGSLVIIDPPYEADNNRGNFNLSIDSMPIFYVAQKVLEAGALCVLLSMPKTYKYNSKFAIDMGQHVSVYQMGRMNNKMFLVMRNEDAKNIGLIDYNYTLITTDETQKAWNGKTNIYKCKSQSTRSFK